MLQIFSLNTLTRALAFLRRRLASEPPPASPHDPYAWKPAPRKPRPNLPSGAVALKEPDD